jgi:hypothetical protein
MENNCIINWELHQKLMRKKKTIKVCLGVGLNQIFPEYLEIEIPSEDKIETDYSEEIKSVKTTKKSKK